jgi:hypothetical protein
MEQIDIFVTSLASFWTQLASFLPQLLAALIILFLGWMLAKVARSGIMRLLRALHFDKVTEKSGLESFLKHAELEVSLAAVLGNLIYWLIILVMIVTVANSLGLTMVAELFNKVLLYIPNVIVAILVLVFGMILARFINRIVFAWLNNVGFDGAPDGVDLLGIRDDDLRLFHRHGAVADRQRTAHRRLHHRLRRLRPGLCHRLRLGRSRLGSRDHRTLDPSEKTRRIKRLPSACVVTPSGDPDGHRAR